MGKSNISFVKLGIFVITGSLLLILAAYLIGNEQKMFSRTFELTTVFNNVGGLQVGNNVRYSGINAGTVRAITMETDTSIRVYMRIDMELQPHIKRDALAMVGSDGLVGSMLINIIPGNGPSVPVESGDEIRSFSRISTQDMLTTLNVTNENAALLMGDLLDITQSIRSGSGVLGRLLNDSTLARDLQESVRNLKLTTAQSNEALTRLNRKISELRFEESALALLLDDPEFSEQVRSIVTGLDSSGQDIRRLTRRLDGLAVSLEAGEGTLGVLLRDSTAARNLQSSLQHLDSGLQKFDQNMEALKHNFLTRGYFRKLERQQKKQD
ncbi:MAG TPA: MlaD family protein [Robiginitalea sp.]|nr:MlaD family protein [Robiginitalea sp.]